MDQGLKGNIERFSLPEILQLIASSRKTGTLGIQKDDDIVLVYFRQGRIIYGFGPRKTFHLGQLMRDRGLISPSQLEEAVAVQAESAIGTRLGQILIDRNYINRADLEDAVRKQVEELVYSLLSWETGSFKFYDDTYPTEEEITVDISVENAILEGYRRLDEQNRIREALPDFDIPLVVAAADSERQTDITLQTDEWNLLALVNGRRSADRIAELSDLSRTEVLNKLAAMKLAGLIATAAADNQPPDSDRLAGMVDRLGELLEHYLESQTGSTREKTSIEDIEMPAMRGNLEKEDVFSHRGEEEL